MNIIKVSAEKFNIRNTEEELVKDVLEIITVFSAKLHSMRSRKNVKALPENLKKLAQLDG